MQYTILQVNLPLLRFTMLLGSTHIGNFCVKYELTKATLIINMKLNSYTTKEQATGVLH